MLANEAVSPLFGLTLRLPPSNLEAEQALLGAILANNKAYERVSELLAAEHFADHVHRKIYQVCADLIEAGRVADAVTLKARFSEDGILEEVGGTAYLTQLLTAMVGIINAPSYAKVIRDCWLRRRMIAVGEDMVNNAFTNDPAMAGADFLDQATAQLNELAIYGSSGATSISLSDAVAGAIAEGEANRRGEGITAVSTGMPSVDAAILKLRAGSLYVVGARPGMGKTALARTVALNVALGMGVTVDGVLIDNQAGGSGICYCSLEETGADFGAGVLANLSGVPIAAILDGSAYGNSPQAIAIVKAQKRMKQGSDLLHVFCAPDQSLRSIRQQAMLARRRLAGNLRLIVIDYLQLMKDPPGARDKRLAVGENARGLKNLAKELDCAVLLLSQLNRGVDDRPDHRPIMRDLRETGEIEDNADVIIFPYREAYYHGQARPKRDPSEPEAVYQSKMNEWQDAHNTIALTAELIVPKVRRGRAPTFVDLAFIPERTRFEEGAR
jgi:replicative DNA helicase